MDIQSKEVCRLCHHEMAYFSTTRKRDYYRCPQCDSIQLKSSYILNQSNEKARYDTHQNDVHDPRYQAFVSPITNYILSSYSSKEKGLDFGAGPGPVIATQLKEKQYNITLFDPYYHNNQVALNRLYDYIFACEVIEHFNEPLETFRTLDRITKTNGDWVFMTWIYEDTIDFSSWQYKNDETHVIFYSKKTLEYLKSKFAFQSLIIKDRLVIFKKKTA